MDKPKPRILTLDVQLAAYLGDWIAHYEKAIQTLAANTAGCLLQGHSAAMPQLPSLRHSNIGTGGAGANIRVSLDSAVGGTAATMPKGSNTQTRQEPSRGNLEYTASSHSRS